jgi:flagellar basal body-associated protein FliL
MSGREAYAKAYDAGRMSDASVVAEANKLMKDPRISVLMESVWETVEQNIIDDAVATRRKVMKDLLDHADNEKNRMGDRLKALEMMGRAIGMFTDKTEAKVETVDAEQLKRELDAHVDRFLSVKKAVH